ncbi:MAG TPA: RidA family protein [Chloroflexota bacterium]|jgi:2-iminobutanoate/2-iminopropanoate deaminase
MAAAYPLLELFAGPPTDPLPLGVRVGDLVFAAGIGGVDPATGALGAGLDRQLALAFQNLRTVLGRAGATLDNVAHVTLYMPDLAERLAFNKPWLAAFPDADDRPPYKYLASPLPGGALAQLEVFAVPGQRRRVLTTPGMAHHDPMAMGVRIGRYLFSSRITGRDTRRDRLGEGAAEQARLAFENVRTLLEHGGATPDDLTQVTAFVTEPAHRPWIEPPWRELFPPGSPRPPLRIVEAALPGPLVRLEIIAVLAAEAS